MLLSEEVVEPVSYLLKSGEVLKKMKEKWKKKKIEVAAEIAGKSSYGSTLSYKNTEKMKAICKHSLLGASGEISDFQEILCYPDELM
ncbi:hypothetical protein Bca52824_094126 [Brassica carinata]|uniref:Uncharacterized protein n=1 Tax=Brassica carinata TaxID=52824 RepID=A0A8X7P505_BRACI|nr:hypothetical protein Bca52824_094126 [Brassica carinata]